MAAKKVEVVKINRVNSGATGTATKTALGASDEKEGNYFENTGREILVFLTGAADREVSFTDKNGVSAGKTKLKESAVSAFGPFDVGQYGTKVSFTTSDKAATVTVLRLTNPKTIQIST